MRINFLLLLFFFPFINPSSIPIWEFMSREEKLGRIFSILVQLVDLTCRVDKPVADCQRTLTLHGVSVLLKKDDHALDLLDPYQRLGQEMIWKSLMEPKFQMPHLKTQVMEQQPPAIRGLKPGKTSYLERPEKKENVG